MTTADKRGMLRGHKSTARSAIYALLEAASDALRMNERSDYAAALSYLEDAAKMIETASLHLRIARDMTPKEDE